MSLGLALLRTVVGALFIGHGLQKLKGWFGGHGLEATGQAFHGWGLRPGKVHAAAAGTAETAGGALFAAGLLTPVAASLLTSTMTVAIRKVHARNGPWATGGGYEYNLVLIAAAFAVVAAGPGSWSLDQRLGLARSGGGLALAELGTGLLGAMAMLRLADRGEPAQAQAEAEETSPERREEAPAEAPAA
jgi:putative oxidoreductase